MTEHPSVAWVCMNTGTICLTGNIPGTWDMTLGSNCLQPIKTSLNPLSWPGKPPRHRCLMVKGRIPAGRKPDGITLTRRGSPGDKPLIQPITPAALRLLGRRKRTSCISTWRSRMSHSWMDMCSLRTGIRILTLWRYSLMRTILVACMYLMRMPLWERTVKMHFHTILHWTHRRMEPWKQTL